MWHVDYICPQKLTYSSHVSYQRFFVRQVTIVPSNGLSLFVAATSVWSSSVEQRSIPTRSVTNRWRSKYVVCRKIIFSLKICGILSYGWSNCLQGYAVVVPPFISRLVLGEAQTSDTYMNHDLSFLVNFIYLRVHCDAYRRDDCMNYFPI